MVEPLHPHRIRFATQLLISAHAIIGVPDPAQVYVPFYYHKYLEVADMHHLSPVQIRNLELQLCLQVPSGPVLDEFMRQYFLYVHPCLPLLDEGRFWAMYSNHGQTGAGVRRLSLALFQAMLFAASRVNQYSNSRDLIAYSE